MTTPLPPRLILCRGCTAYPCDPGEPCNAIPPEPTIHGVEEVQGPLVRQPEPAARLARILHNAAQELWDACTGADTEHMKAEARAVANRVRAACSS